MFMGHYAAAFAAKAVEPRLPLWVAVGGAGLLDIAWSITVMTGLEPLKIDPALPGSTLIMPDMPWTHSLLAATIWAVAAAWAGRAGLNLPLRAATLLGLVVLSHWCLDLLVHRPDLALWPGSLKFGFGLWNTPVIEEAVEIGVLGLAFGAWMARGGGAMMGRALAFFTLLMTIQIVNLVRPPSGGAVALGLSALAVYLGITLAAYFVEASPRRKRTL